MNLEIAAELRGKQGQPGMVQFGVVPTRSLPMAYRTSKKRDRRANPRACNLASSGLIVLFSS